MKFLMMFLMFFLGITQAFAYVVPTYRDLKPASQVMLENQDFGTPVATSSAYVKATYAGNTASTEVNLTSFLHQPDVARNLVITPGGTTSHISGATIVVTGTNILGATISENFVMPEYASSAVTGSKAFKTVTNVKFPALLEGRGNGYGATWDIGVGEKIGLKRCMAYAGDWAWSMVGGVYETTRATVVANASAVESNTADFNGTMDGSARFIGRFIQNFACLP